jgi:hypothetical protein
MRIIQFDKFESVQHVTPIPVRFTYDQMLNWIFYFKDIDKKEDRKACFSFTKYKEGRTRGKENIEFMTGIVFDFDNKHKPIKPMEEIVSVLEKNRIMHFWYDTFQSTIDSPRWRLIIPFSEPLPIEKWEAVYEKVFHYIGSPLGVDPVSKKSAQLYFDPYAPKSGASLFQSHAFNGNILNVIDIPDIPIPNETKETQSNAIDLKKKFSRNNNTDKITSALSFISPDVDYDCWIRIGMALKSELGQSGYDIWNQWSGQGIKYKNEKDLSQHWKSFKKSGVSIGTLYGMAQERGFVMPFDDVHDVSIYPVSPQKMPSNFIQHTEQNHDPIIDIAEETLEEIINVCIEKLDYYANIDIFDIPSPLLKKLFEWLESSSKIFQPIYSLATALSIMAFLKRNTIISPTKLRTNLYILSIGPSRSGKNNGLERIFQVMSEVGLENYLTSGVGSHQGLLKQLKENNGCVFWKQDELSYMLKGFNNKNASTHEQNIEQKLLTLYNCKYQTTDATKGDKLERIKDPYLNIYSTATEQIVEILKPQSAISGLLARFLIFWVHPGEPYKDNFHPYEEIPPDLLEQLKTFEAQRAIKQAIFTPEAKEWYGKFLKEVRASQRILSENGTKVDSLVGNLPEQATKLALLTAVFDVLPAGDKNNQIKYENWPHIRLEDIQWGVSIAMHCLKNNIAIANTFSDNHNEKIVNKIRDKIKNKTKDGRWITKSSLWRAVRYIANSRQLDEILSLLSEAGDIEKNHNNSSRGYKVRWNNKQKTEK